MTCVVQQFEQFRWYFDGTGIAAFVYEKQYQYPRNIYNSNGITINVTSATVESPMSVTFNATSVLSSTTLALSLLGADSIQCGNRQFRSQAINLTMLNINGMVTYITSYSLYIKANEKTAHFFWLFEVQSCNSHEPQNGHSVLLRILA